MSTQSPQFLECGLAAKLFVNFFLGNHLAFGFRFRFYSINKRICRVSFSSSPFVWH